MILNIIISAIAFVLYLQTGFFVFWKNQRAPVNLWFFGISAYLALLSILLTVIDPIVEQGIVLSICIRAAWSIIPAFLFRFHTFLADVPRKKSTRDNWFLTFLFLGLMVSLFMLSALISVDKDRLQVIAELFWVRLVWNYLFHALMFANLAALSYQYYHWRKQIAWRKERKEFSLVVHSLVIPGVVISLLLSFDTLQQPAMLLRLPHIFLMPWFLIVAYGFARYKLSPTDPAKAASNVLKDIRQLLLFCDDKLQLKEMNAYAQQLLKPLPNKNKNPEIIAFFEDQQQIRQLVKEAGVTGHAGPCEMNIIAGDGKLIPFSISCAILNDRFGDSYGMAFYGTDLIETHALRDEIRRRAEVEQSLRNIYTDLEAEVVKRSLEIRYTLVEAERKLHDRLNSEDIVKAYLTEFDIIVGEVHVRNIINIRILLSMLINSRNQGLTNPEKRQMQSLYERINSILIVNTQVLRYDQYGLVRFNVFLELLVQSYQKFYDIPAEIRISANDELLWIDQALPLALVANELISNSFLHAFKDEAPKSAYIRIKYWHDKNQSCNLEVSDNGCGIADVNEISGSGYNGLHLASLLVKDQLNGQMDITHQHGTHIRISVPSDQLRQGHMGHDS